MGLVLILGWGSSAFAQAIDFPTTRILGGAPQYSGRDGESFSETGTGISGELQIEMGGAWIAPFASARGAYVTGTQAFLDGTTSIDSSFTYLQGGLDLGLRLFPVRRRKAGFNIYLGASGGLSYQSIQLGEALTTTSIPKSDQSLGTGVSGFVGAEWLLGGASKNKWATFVELVHRTESSKILEQDKFDLRSVTVSFGLGW